MPPAQIDHIVLLLSYRDLLNPPPWLTTNFTIAPGGHHADGRTENKLILFADGTYLELVAFIDDQPSHRYGHFWGDKKPGFISFAFTNPTGPDHAALTARIAAPAAPLKVSYAQPVDGGRKRTDGQDVRWQVTFPSPTPRFSSMSSFSRQRGEVPYWCHDVTPRALRVDVANTAFTTHACGARGIAQVTVLVPKGKVDHYVELYSAIMNTQPVRVFGTTRLPVETPVVVQGLPKPWVFVEEPTVEHEVRRVREQGAGIVEIALRVQSDGGVGLARNPISENGVWIHFLK